MGKVRAVYLVRVTVRDENDDAALAEGFEAPTNADVESVVRTAIAEDIAERHDAGFLVNVTSERVDW